MFVGNNILGHIVSFENVEGLVFSHDSHIFIFKGLSLVNNSLRLKQHSLVFFDCFYINPLLL